VVLYHLGCIIRDKLAASIDERDGPILDFIWGYPAEGPIAAGRVRTTGN